MAVQRKWTIFSSDHAIIITLELGYYVNVFHSPADNWWQLDIHDLHVSSRAHIESFFLRRSWPSRFFFGSNTNNTPLFKKKLWRRPILITRNVRFSSKGTFLWPHLFSSGSVCCWMDSLCVHTYHYIYYIYSIINSIIIGDYVNQTKAYHCLYLLSFSSIDNLLASCTV